MFTEIKAWFASAEAVLWAIGVVALIAWGLWAVHHERDIGRRQVIAADTKARAEEDAKNAAQLAVMTAQAAKAESDRATTQAVFDGYLSQHPVHSVLVCNPSNNGKPAGSAGQGSSAAGSGPGPASVPQVSGGSRDIGPALDTIVQAAGRLAILYKDAQSQPEIKP